TLHALAQLGQWDRRGVARQQRIGLHPRLDARVQVALGVGALDDRLDHQVRARRAFACQVALQPRRDRRALALVLHLLREQLTGAVHRGVDEALLTVVERYFEALVGRPRGDVTAHHTRTDDMHAADAVVTPGSALEALLQEENPDQVARGRGRRQPGNRLAFGGQLACGATAGVLPRVDERVRRRVVLLAGLARHLLERHRRDHLPRQPGVGRPTH